MSAPIDTVDLLINGNEILCVKEYDVSIAYFTTPSTFSITLGSNKTLLDVMRICPPNSLFALRVNGIVQFVGYTDGFPRLGGNGSEVVISGRDVMAQLVRDCIEHERSFNNATFEDLGLAAILGSGIQEPTLWLDTASQRAAVVGTPVVDSSVVTTTIKSKPVVGQPVPAEVRIVAVDERVGLVFDVVQDRVGTTTVETIQKKTVTRIKGYKAEKPIKWDAGETWLGAAKKDFDRAGIFLRAGVDPDGLDPNVFILGTPNAEQPATFFLLNTRSETTPENAVLVSPPDGQYVMSGRHSDYVVLGQAGGGKDGRKAVVGRYHDAEVASAGITAKLVWKDPQAKNKRQADFLARKKCAEERRGNRSFTYTIPGRHTLPLMRNPRERAIPVPDCTVYVRDDEIGLDDTFWLSAVQHHSSSRGGTFTKLTIIDRRDLVFGEDESTAPVPGPPVKRHKRRS